MSDVVCPNCGKAEGCACVESSGRVLGNLRDFWIRTTKKELKRGVDPRSFTLAAVHSDLTHAVFLSKDVLKWERDEWILYLTGYWDDAEKMDRDNPSGLNS